MKAWVTHEGVLVVESENSTDWCAINYALDKSDVILITESVLPYSMNGQRKYIKVSINKEAQ